MDVGCTNVILFTRSEPQKAEMLIHYIYIYCYYDCQLKLLAWLFLMHSHFVLAQAPNTVLFCVFFCLFVFFEWGGDGGSSSTVQNVRNVALLNHKKSAELTSAKLFCNWGE